MIEVKEQPKTFKEKLDNFWYYSWKYVILGAVLLAVVIAGTVTMCAQPTYYTSVLVGTVTKGIDSESGLVVSVGEKLNTYAVSNEKGLPIDMCVVNYTSDEFSQSNMSWDVQLTAELESAESQLYIFDSTMYERLLDQNAFVDLQAAFPEYDIPMQYAVPLKDTPLYDIEIPLPEDGLPEGEDEDTYRAEQRAILDDLYICFRVDNGKHADRRVAQWEMLEGLLTDTFSK